MIRNKKILVYRKSIIDENDIEVLSIQQAVKELKKQHTNVKQLKNFLINQKEVQTLFYKYKRI